MINPISFVNEVEDIYSYNIMRKINRGTLIEAHISDLHFGALDPKYQYETLREQFTNKIEQLPLDIATIDGDIFDHKFMSNSDAIMYALMFIDDFINRICRVKGVTLIIISGTEGHDANQLKLFYHYLNDSTIDIRIVEDIRFEHVKGAKILCIPEKYGIKSEVYEQFLFHSGMYDSVFMHGTIKGAIYGDNAGESRLFTIQDFCNCKGPILSGHVHVPGCHYSHFYYCGSPLRWKFGEEEEKGFLIVLHNLDTSQYYIHMEYIKSFRYDTINLDHMLTLDPKDIIQYVNGLKNQGIDYIRIEFNHQSDNIDNLELIKNYYKNNSNIKINIKEDRRNKLLKISPEQVEEMKKYNYIFDKSLSEYNIFTRYVNEDKGYEYITVEKLLQLLGEE
jgi:DNA repair exonuclease SbcCD nuclease subunit